MLFISEHGLVDDVRIKVDIYPEIERGPMDKVNGIVVHQTDGAKIGSTFNSYKNKGANGAHFLIDKDGTIYQTASVYKRTNHVGRLKSRCLRTEECTPSEFKQVFALRHKRNELSRHEYKKDWPERYPSNMDSIGIELVGRMDRETEIYERVTDQQNNSLRWLVEELHDVLGVSVREIYRHPDLSYKMKTEASTAKWD